MGADEFDYAAERVFDLPRTPDNNTLLDLYKFYKQALVGDCNTGRPGGWDVKGQRKWDAWNSVRGMSGHEARERYVDIVKGLFGEQDQGF